MTWHQIKRIVEGRLYEYGARMAEEPPVSISSAYDSPAPPPRSGRTGTSLPERWVMNREDVIAFGRVLQSLPATERRLVDARYIRALSWKQTCRELAVSYPEAHRIRDRAIVLLAGMLGLLPGPAAEVETNARQT